VLGFEAVWLAIMFNIALQTSSMTPPYAQAIFFLKRAADPKPGVTTGVIIRGVTPFILLIGVEVLLCVAFPQIVTWLPGTMVK